MVKNYEFFTSSGKAHEKVTFRQLLLETSRFEKFCSLTDKKHRIRTKKEPKIPL